MCPGCAPLCHYGLAFALLGPPSEVSIDDRFPSLKNFFFVTMLLISTALMMELDFQDVASMDGNELLDTVRQCEMPRFCARVRTV